MINKFLKNIKISNNTRVDAITCCECDEKIGLYINTRMTTLLTGIKLISE